MAESSARPEILELLEQADWLAPLVRSLLRDPHEVDDVLQETWLQVLRHPPVGAALASPRAWLARIAWRIALRRRERNRSRHLREREVAVPEAALDPEAVTERLRLQRELATLVLGLEEPYRTAITLRYLEGLSGATLARRLGIRDEAARKRVSRGLERLRQRLDEAHEGEREHWQQRLGAIVLLYPGPEAPGSGASALPWVGAGLALGGTALWLLLARAPDAVAPPLAPQATVARQEPRALLDEGPPAALARRESVPSSAESLRSGPALRGVVLAPDGSPVAGARIEVRHPDRSAVDPDAGPEAGVLVGETRTDARGQFTLAVPGGGLVDVAVAADGLGRVLLPERVAPDELTVAFAPAARLRVTLRAESGGAPLAGARFRLLQHWLAEGTTRELLRGTSDARGRIELDGLPPGRVQLDVVGTDTSDVSAVLELAPAAVLERTFVVPAARRLRGRVVDGRTGAALAGAELLAAPRGVGSRWSPETLGRGWRTRAAQSDALGGFELALGRDYLGSSLRVSAPGHAPLFLELEQDEDELALELEPGWSLRGRVAGPDGAPLAAARLVAVALPAQAGGVARPDWRETHSAADGAFELADLGRGDAHLLRVSAQGCASVYRVVPAAPDGTPGELGEIRLAAPARVLGLVLDADGELVAEASVTLVPDVAALGARPELAAPCTRTDSRGHFVLEGAPAGSCRLQAHLRGRSSPVRTLELEPGAEVGPLELVLAPARRIAGTVEDARGRPLANACVILDAEERDAQPEVVVTGADGAFLFELEEPGSYGLRCAPNSIHQEGGDVLVHALDLHGVVAGTEGLRVVLPPAELVTGWVLSAAGEPLGGVVVFARGPGGTLLTYEYSAPDGRFLLRLPPGVRVDLSTHDARGAEHVHLRAVQAGTLDLELTL